VIEDDPETMKTSIATANVDEAGGPRKRGLPVWLISNEFGLFLLLVLFCVLFGVLTPGFTSPFNLFAVTRTGTVNVLIGLAMMTVIVTGGLDLSVGAIGVAASMMAGWLMQDLALSVPVAVLGGVVTGGVLGLVNGQLIVRSGMHSFVVTLATTSIFFGIMIILTHAQPFNLLPDSFGAVGLLRLGRWLSPMLLVSFALAAVLAYLYRLTDIGRQMLAAGANPRAARLSGIAVGRVVTLCHILAGLLAAIAAIALSMRNGAAIPSMAGNLGQDWLLPAFLAPVLGGVPLSGGRASVLGTVLGGLLVTVLNSGLLLLHIGAFWVQFSLGVILLIAVLIDKARLRVVSGMKG
jgi:ribose transport system permease protein